VLSGRQRLHDTGAGRGRGREGGGRTRSCCTVHTTSCCMQLYSSKSCVGQFQTRNQFF
jgi:hypothetical protein